MKGSREGDFMHNVSWGEQWIPTKQGRGQRQVTITPQGLESIDFGARIPGFKSQTHQLLAEGHNLFVLQ